MWRIVNLPEEDQATDICSMHKTFGKDPSCGSEDILADRHTHRQTYSSQYLATAPEGKVIIEQKRTVLLIFLVILRSIRPRYGTANKIMTMSQGFMSYLTN